MDEEFLSNLASDVKVMQADLKYIREKIDTEKVHSQKIGKLRANQLYDHEGRIRNIERLMYKGLGAAILLSVFLSIIVSYFLRAYS